MITRRREVISEENPEQSSLFSVTSDYSKSDHAEVRTGTGNAVMTTSVLGVIEEDIPEPSTQVEAQGSSSSFLSSSSPSSSSSPPPTTMATSTGRTTVSHQRDVTSTGINVAIVPSATTELSGELATPQSTDTVEHQVSSTTGSHPNSTNPSEPVQSLPTSSTSALHPEFLQPLAWEEWTYWSQCSATCGQGSMLRWKLCQNDNNGTATCDVEMGRGISE